MEMTNSNVVCYWLQNLVFLHGNMKTLSGVSLSEPKIHERQEAVLYVYIYVSLWGDHFSEERVKF